MCMDALRSQFMSIDEVRKALHACSPTTHRRPKDDTLSHPHAQACKIKTPRVARGGRRQRSAVVGPQRPNGRDDMLLSLRPTSPPARSRRRRSVRGRRRPVQRNRLLRCEPLEQRLLLAAMAVTNTNDSGLGSLRDAITQANASSGFDQITFNISGLGPHSIRLESALPTITRSVMIDGWSQRGFSGVPIIELDGGDTTAASGLYITAGNTTVRGLVINGFDEYGIHIDGGDNNVVEGNYIGTNLAGSATVNNGKTGVYIRNGASSNRVGTDGDGRNDGRESNLISGNNFDGVAIEDVGSDNNVVAGNYIGTDVTARGRSEEITSAFAF